jgi:hypothetical protein
MISRRSILLAAPALLLAPRALAQYSGGDMGGAMQGPPALTDAEMAERYGQVFEPKEDLSDWFESLKRPDIAAGKPHLGNADNMTAVSCCSAGDAYPCEILEEASPPHGGTVENGRLRIIDRTKRQIRVMTKNDNGSRYGRMLYRGELNDDQEFQKYSSDKVTREKDGNPTSTAWVFLRNDQGTVAYIYCVVPLPPGV